MSSRSLFDLHDYFKPIAIAFVEQAEKAGLDVLIYCTFRTGVEQDELYAHGRTAPGAIVTNARAGESAHNFGLAFDGVPLIHGKPMWDEAHSVWKTYGDVARLVGAEWAGSWTGFKEKPHVQHPEWKRIVGIT